MGPRPGPRRGDRRRAFLRWPADVDGRGGRHPGRRADPVLDPLHPPGKPERARTEHLPGLTVPTVFTHGSADPFGTLDELRAAAALVNGPVEIVEIIGARHDLGSKTLDVPALAVDAALEMLA